jgi:hypothetical protein
MNRPAIRTHFAGDGGWIHNLGDALVPHIIGALGFDCVSHRAPDSRVVNPGRCLLVIGSLLTNPDLRRMPIPVDIWGCGWKGADAWRGLEVDANFYAVRGPLTRAGIGLAADMALGDPALLLPHLFRRPRQDNGLNLLVQHIDRVGSAKARERAVSAGCDKFLSPWVYAAVGLQTAQLARWWTTLADLRRWGADLRGSVHPLWETVDQIAGAKFVLTGSLHGAILAQAYGIPWAAFDDGCVDSPSKWEDWGAYLGIEIAFVKDLIEGQEWWGDTGKLARIQSLSALLRSFPYINKSPLAHQILARLEQSAPHFVSES